MPGTSERLAAILSALGVARAVELAAHAPHVSGWLMLAYLLEQTTVRPALLFRAVRDAGCFGGAS